MFTFILFLFQLASTVRQRSASNPRDPYASNWLERLRQIKRIRSKATSASKQTQGGGGGGGSDNVTTGGLNSAVSRDIGGSGYGDDFTDYC